MNICRIFILFLSLLGWCNCQFHENEDNFGKHLSEDSYSENIIPNQIIPGKDTRSGIFWTGSRYNRRGLIRQEVKPRTERFFMGPRYGKRSSEENTKQMIINAKLCEALSSIQSLTPCNTRYFKRSSAESLK